MEMVIEMNLGKSGVGKTVFISALSQTLVSSVKKSGGVVANMNARAENGETDMFTGVARAMGMKRYNLSERMGKLRGTTEMEKFFFDVNLLDETTNIEYEIPSCFIEYRGGATTDVRNKEELEETGTLIKHLQDSDVIRIFAEAPVLYMNRNDIEKAKKTIGASLYNQYFSLLYKKSTKTSVSVVLVLTKCDNEIISPEYRENGYSLLKKLAIKVFDTVFVFAGKMHNKSMWSFSIIPVSACEVGASTSKYNEEYETYFAIPKADAKLIPKNIDVSYLLGICLHLESKSKKIQESIDMYKEDIFNINVNSLFDRKANRARFEKSKAKINELEQRQSEYKGAAQCIRKLLANEMSDVTLLYT